MLGGHEPKTDLHTHTTASDGLDSPARLVELATEQGISILGVTDHDTVGGIAEAQTAGEAHNVQIVPGVEFSVRSRRGQTHILGYGIDPSNAELTSELASLRASRAERGSEIVRRLSGLGIRLDSEAIEREREGKSAGRPHIARALIVAGHADSIDDAFNRYLAVGRPAFVPRRTVSAERAIDIILQAGGIAVLAHPYSVAELAARLPGWVEAGLAGLEAHYGAYNKDQRSALADLASSYNLLVTGGSDYHGEPDNRKRALGSVSWPNRDLDTFLAALR